MSTPFMDLNLPSPLVTLGPAWATMLNAALTAVDAHDHTPGFGVPVPSAGLNINADLDFQGNSAINLASINLAAQASAIALAGTFQSVNGDLVWINASGTQVPITQGNSIVGTPGNIQNLDSPAAAIYSAGTSSFRWFSGASQMAGLDAGFLTIREGFGSTLDGITIRAAATGVSTYSIILPTSVPPPQASGFSAINTSTYGVTTSTQSYAWLDNVTLEEYSSFGGKYYRIKSLGVSTAKLADLAVTTIKLANAPNGVTTAKINDLQVTTAKLANAPDGVSEEKINDSAVSTRTIAALSVTGAKLADAPNGITTAKINDLQVTGDKLANAPNGITTAKINDLQVTTEKIGNSQVTTEKIGDLQVTTEKIGDSQVTTAKIGNSQVTGAKIASSPNGVATGNINDGAVATAKIGDSQVTTAKIGDGQVTTAKIGDGQVTTAKIGDGQVTTAKIGDGQVTTAKIGNLQVETAKIGNLQVTGDKIANNAVDYTKTDGFFVYALQPTQFNNQAISYNNAWDEVVKYQNLVLRPNELANLCISFHPKANGDISRFYAYNEANNDDSSLFIRTRIIRTPSTGPETVLRTYIHTIWLRRKLVVNLSPVNNDVFYSSFPGFSIVDSGPVVSEADYYKVVVDVSADGADVKATINYWALCISRL